MKGNLGALAVGLLTLMTVIGCVPVAEPDLAIALPTATPQPVATATPVPEWANVAVLGSGFASTGDESAQFAIDDDPDSFWDSQRPPVQWFSVVLDDLYLVDRVEMAVAQAAAGPATHEIWLGNPSGRRTLYKRLSNVHTEDGQILDVAIEPPRIVNEVFILTLDSPGQVAWREVRVLVSPPANPVETVWAPPMKLNKIAGDRISLPVQVTHAGDGSGRAFVVDQRGRIRIIRDGAISDTIFLDLSGRINCCVERGLLNVAFPPEYATGQQFYVSYTNTNDDTVISRFTTSADPDKADPDSEEVVLLLEQPHLAHNSGYMAFGPQDGYLYIGSGDGGSFFEPFNTAQDPTTLLGAILRIDVESGVKPYGIPASNPFAQNDGYRGEIWVLGLRNPWGFAFDKQTGALYIPDTGDSKREEVNYQPAGSEGGENFGWGFMEGNQCFGHWHGICSADGLTQPVVEYDHSRGCAVVGGAVYQGNSYPGLQGHFLFSDFCLGEIWGLKRLEGDGQDGWQSTLLVNAAMPISSIGEDEEGNVYVTGYADGAVYMLTER